MATEIRKNFVKLDKDEKERYVKSVRHMLHGTTNTYRKFAQNHLDYAGGAHRSALFLHWHRAFIRLFELDLKTAHNDLYGNRNITLPYWDWTRQRSKRGRLWRKKFMGPNGNGTVTAPATTDVVDKGPFAHPDFVTSGDPWFPGWEVKIIPEPPEPQVLTPFPLTRMMGEGISLPRKGQVRRALRSKVFDVYPFNDGVSVADTTTTSAILVTDDTIEVNRTTGLAPGQRIIIDGSITRKIKEVSSSTSELVLTKEVGTAFASTGVSVQGKRGFQGKYLSFRNRFEGWIDDFGNSQTRLHNAVHVWVGGLMGDVPTAPIDPVFFLHHCNVDRLWARWQSRNRVEEMQYIPDADAVSSGNYGLNDNMDPWTIKAKEVNNWQDLGNSLLHDGSNIGYVYDDDPIVPMSFT